MIHKITSNSIRSSHCAIYILYSNQSIEYISQDANKNLKIIKNIQHIYTLNQIRLNTISLCLFSKINYLLHAVGTWTWKFIHELDNIQLTTTDFELNCRLVEISIWVGKEAHSLCSHFFAYSTYVNVYHFGVFFFPFLFSLSCFACKGRAENIHQHVRIISSL